MKNLFMDALVLLALAIAPGLAISIFIYRKDKFDKEPPRFHNYCIHPAWWLLFLQF
jgi:hypothetical protein